MGEISLSEFKNRIEMQSRVVEIDDQGPVRRRANGNDEERKGPQDYPERNPLDLIEEDKRPFVRRKLLATCCGGVRTVYDEVTAQPLPCALLAVQILTYLFYPGLILLSTRTLWPDFNDREASCAFVAAISFFVCSLLHGSSFLLKRKELAHAAQKSVQQSKTSLRPGL